MSSSYPAASSTSSSARGLLAGLAALLLVALLVACGGGTPAPADSDSIKTTPAATTGTAAPSSAATAAPTAGTVPANVNDEPVAFMTPDGVTLRGHLYSAAGPKRKVLVIASALPQSTWKPYAGEFISRGVALLTFDTRGVGETGGARNDARNADDIALAVSFIRSRDYPQSYVMGIGTPFAAAAFTAAGNTEVAGVAASPAGVNTTQELARITAPKLYIMNKGDGTSEANAKLAVNTAPGPGVYVTVLDPPPPPDTVILSVADARKALLDFIAR